MVGQALSPDTILTDPPAPIVTNEWQAIDQSPLPDLVMTSGPNASSTRNWGLPNIGYGGCQPEP
jgi:hypothetical protein